MVKKEFSSMPFNNLKLIDENRDHFIARCPFCGDSKNHTNKGHLYLSKKLPVFFCQRCGVGGSIEQLENELKEPCKYVYTNDLQMDNDNYKTTSTRKKKTINKDQLSQKEIDYLDSRCDGLKITDIEDYMNLFNLVSINKVMDKCRKGSDEVTNPKIIDNRVWFQSVMGGILAGRTINNDDIRWYKISRKGTEVNDLITDSYCIDNYSDNRITAPDTLVIAEGIFDIIPIYLNRKKYGIKDNAIFIACLGIFYKRAIKTFQNLFSRRPKNVLVFVDKGVTEEMLHKQFVGAKGRGDKITVYIPPVKDWEESPLPRMKFEL